MILIFVHGYRYYLQINNKDPDCEDYLNKKFHGIGGPLNVADIRSNYEILDKLIIAAETCGYPKNNDFNGRSQEGFGYYQVTQKNGLRASTKHSFLDPF